MLAESRRLDEYCRHVNRVDLGKAPTSRRSWERKKRAPPRGFEPPGRRPDLEVAGLREGQLPAVDVAGVLGRVVLHPQLPGAVGHLGGGVDRVRGVEVVGAAAG